MYAHIHCFHPSPSCSNPRTLPFLPPTSIVPMAFQAFRWGNKSLQGPSSSPIGQDEWDQHRELLRHLYSEADMTLEATMEYMRAHHDFTPSYVHQQNLR